MQLQLQCGGSEDGRGEDDGTGNGTGDGGRSGAATPRRGNEGVGESTEGARA